jgi:uncharacterized SAM-binding protein YcdF (DUF218 family)
LLAWGGRNPANNPKDCRALNLFVIKKIVGAFVMPIGLVVLALIGSGFCWLIRGHKKAGGFNLLLGMGVWIASLPMTANWLDRNLTADLQMPGKIEGDVIVLLGGGADNEAIDLTGQGVPADIMAARLVTAARLYRRLSVPIIVTGGAVFDGTRSEAAVVRRFLEDLGVPAAGVIAEEKARDTMENARYTAQICASRGFYRPLLVTSPVHYKRAMWCFQRVGLEVAPVPVGHRQPQWANGGWHDWLPGDLNRLTATLHEHIGLAYYRLTH